jgi:hypothetical protein
MHFEPSIFSVLSLLLLRLLFLLLPPPLTSIMFRFEQFCLEFFFILEASQAVHRLRVGRLSVYDTMAL